MSNIKRIVICAMCIALCYVLPIAFHSVGLGSALSPMHIPVLLCGTVCGGGYGALCGILGPVLSSLLSGMPPMILLTRMIPELCVYGLSCGLMMRFVRTGSTLVDLYISLTAAMLAGRIAGGIASVIFYTFTSGVYSVALWVSGYFVEAIPGIAAQLVLIPLLVLTLEKARVIPGRYGKVSV